MSAWASAGLIGGGARKEEAPSWSGLQCRALLRLDCVLIWGSA
jgi:hypothetical protein